MEIQSTSIAKSRAASVPDPPPPPRIFINYRHKDTQGTAWALFFKLECRYGPEHVFFDNGTIRPGMQWLEEIESQLKEAGALLVLIGDEWMSCLLKHLKSREADYVAKEIELALRSGSNTTVIPVLVDNAELPQAKELPPALKSLPACQTEHLRHQRLRHDIDGLLGRIDELRESVKPANTGGSA
jgi:hypothetical protein